MVTTTSRSYTHSTRWSFTWNTNRGIERANDILSESEAQYFIYTIDTPCPHNFLFKCLEGFIEFRIPIDKDELKSRIPPDVWDEEEFVVKKCSLDHARRDTRRCKRSGSLYWEERLVRETNQSRQPVTPFPSSTRVAPRHIQEQVDSCYQMMLNDPLITPQPLSFYRFG